VVGGNANSKVQNCVALNPSVTRTSTGNTIGRVVGSNAGTLSNNHARDDMQLMLNGTPQNPSDKGDSGLDGADVPAEDYSDLPFWENLSIGANGTPGRIFWDFENVWKWEEGLLPILIGVGGEQNPTVQPLSL